MNRSEDDRHRFAVGLSSQLGRRVLVPWPVFTDVDLLQQHAAPSDDEMATAFDLAERYPESGVDLPELPST